MNIQRGKKFVEMVLSTHLESNEENVNQQSVLNTENLVVDDPIPSTSSGQVSSLTYYSVLDFSSDDSVRDPCYKLPRLPITSSSSTCDEISMNPNVSPKKSIRTIKREKKNT
ncbi:uncharacterized protein LOC114245174 [Bombyx mandarina]|uniref:Uncharacterized protein LOC114245174 n=1 Tax=Bombyx mandarina TaxID=7092 RepID=A0A6J2JVV6_BOMMA|nr:uncharacterized protein LOC114245174 [Bombyx mandarina]